MKRNQRVGMWGELAAAEYLSTHGYEVLERNVRTPYGEIDLVASKAGRTVFVEVKARTSPAFGPPEISVGRRKQEHMLSCAQFYAQHNALDHWQIDVIAVDRFGGKDRIKHFENAIS